MQLWYVFQCLDLIQTLRFRGGSVVLNRGVPCLLFNRPFFKRMLLRILLLFVCLSCFVCLHFFLQFLNLSLPPFPLPPKKNTLTTKRRTNEQTDRMRQTIKKYLLCKVTYLYLIVWGLLILVYVFRHLFYRFLFSLDCLLALRWDINFGTNRAPPVVLVDFFSFPFDVTPMYQLLLNADW